MKVLHIANFAYNSHGASFYNSDRKLSAGWVRNGHFVYEFSSRDMARMGTVFRSKHWGGGWMNREILRICEQVEPDLVLLGHAQLVKPETLAEIRRLYPNTAIALWYVDALFHYHKTGYMKAWAPYLDVIFATTGGELLRDLVPGPTVRAYFPNPVEASVESLRNFERRDFAREFIFCGSVGGDPEREQYLNGLQQALAGIETRFYGMPGVPTVNGVSYYRALAEARMGLNYSRLNDVCLYSSDRVAQLTGNGLLTLSPRIPGFDILFREHELAYFATTEELIEKVRYYAAHPEEAATVARAGWQRAHEVCAAERVARFMEETIFGKPYSSDYEWRNEVYR